LEQDPITIARVGLLDVDNGLGGIDYRRRRAAALYLAVGEEWLAERVQPRALEHTGYG